MDVLNLATAKSPFFKLQVKSLEEMGINVDTISVPGSARERKNRHYIKFYLKMISTLSRQYDLIHANYGLVAPIALLQPIRPVVLTLWGSDLMGKYSLLTKQAAKYCDEVIVMSDEMETRLGQSAHIIPHGVDTDQFKPMDQLRCQKAVGWNSGTKHILFPYDPSREVKNYPLAKQVVNRVQDRLSTPVELQTVYGVDHDEIPVFMNAADALFLTSKREGSPNTIKEAMACNLPIVATDVGDVREHLANVKLTYVCDQEKKMATALNEILKKEERSNSRQHIQHLSLEKMGEKISGVYEQALAD